MMAGRYLALNEVSFKSALPVLARIEDAGYEAYFVGGCVRDKLLDLPIHDIDIASSALPEEIEGIFTHTIDVGKEHGTVIALVAGEPYEITTFRTESDYSDHRRPDQVHFVRNLEEDTLRRDFTINALAVNRYGELFDYHHGLEDLKSGLIRAVGVAADRFEEDALRMWRAIRFASQLGFSIEALTLKAIQTLAQQIQYVSVERIRIEASKFFSGPYLASVSHLLSLSGLGRFFAGMAELSDIEVDQLVGELAQQLAVYHQVSVPVDERLLWCLLIQRLPLANDQYRSYLRQWKHSNRFIDEVLEIDQLMIAFDQQERSNRFVYQHSLELLLLVEDFYLRHHRLSAPWVERHYQQLPIQSRDQLVVNGSAVMQILALSQGGPLIGEILTAVEAAVVAGRLANDLESVTHYIQQFNDRRSGQGGD